MSYKTPVTVELYYSGAWHDITSDVATTPAISITRGRADETAQPAPGVCTLTLLNADATYSPRNPSSALYGLIGRNTPIRVSVTGFGTRFVGEVESWPQTWDPSGNVARVPVTAYGITRRLLATGSRTPVRSAMAWAMTTDAPVVSWPLEQASVAQLARTDTGPTGTAQLSPTDGPGGADGAGRFRITVETGASVTSTASPGLPAAPTYTSTGTTIITAHVRQSFADGPKDINYVESTIKLSASSDGADASAVVGVRFEWDTGLATSVFPDIVAVRAFTADGSNTVIASTGAGTDIVDGEWHELQVRITQNGADLDTEFWIDGTQKDTRTAASLTLGVITGAEELSCWFQDSSGAVGGTGGFDASWITVHTDDTVGQFYVAESPTAMNGYTGETVAARLGRVADLDATTISIVGDGATPLGPQPIATAWDIRQDAITADGGMLIEDRDDRTLSYVARDALYNLTPSVTLDYGAKEVSPPLQPVEDTAHVANDITVSRPNGTPANATATTGPLNVSDPTDDPEGIGRYPVQVTLNLATDDQAAGHAAWLLHVGTWDEPRYPTITANLTGLHEAGKTTLMADVAALDVAGRVEVTDPPAWQGTDTVSQLVQGYTEILGSHLWTWTGDTSPARPWDVGTYAATPIDSTTKRYDTLSSTLTSSVVAGTATSLSVTIAAGGALWTTKSSSFTGLQVEAGGAVWAVTSITGTSSPQTINVTATCVNGVVKTLAAGTQVRVAPAQRATRGL